MKFTQRSSIRRPRYGNTHVNTVKVDPMTFILRSPVSLVAGASVVSALFLACSKTPIRPDEPSINAAGGTAPAAGGAGGQGGDSQGGGMAGSAGSPLTCAAGMVACSKTNACAPFDEGCDSAPIVFEVREIQTGDLPLWRAGIQAVDVNHDGHLDLVCVNNRGGKQIVPAGLSESLRVYLGRGDGTFEDPRDLAIGGWPFNPRAADFDEDGNVDLIVGGREALRLFRGAGDGTFALTLQFVTSAVEPHVLVATADLDQDGHMDFVTSVEGVPKIAVYIGDGKGGFTVNTVDVPEAVIGLAALSLTTGKVPYLALGSGKTIQIGQLTGGAQVAFTSTWSVKSAATEFLAADLDRDGADELVGYSSGGSPSVIHLSDDTTTIEPMVSGGMESVAVGDFNGDGDPDAVTAAIGSQIAVPYRGRGNRRFTADAEVPVGGTLGPMVVGDFDEDGRADVVVNMYGPKKLFLNRTPK
jgi:hypothetical protein